MPPCTLSPGVIFKRTLGLAGVAGRRKSRKESRSLLLSSPPLVAPSRSGKILLDEAVAKGEAMDKRVFYHYYLFTTVLARPALTTGCPPGQKTGLKEAVSTRRASPPLSFRSFLRVGSRGPSKETLSSTVHKNPLRASVPPFHSEERKRGPVGFTVPLTPPPLRGVQGNGAVTRRWSQAQLPLFKEKKKKRGERE